MVLRDGVKRVSTSHGKHELSEIHAAPESTHGRFRVRPQLKVFQGQIPPVKSHWPKSLPGLAEQRQPGFRICRPGHCLAIESKLLQ